MNDDDLVEAVGDGSILMIDIPPARLTAALCTRLVRINGAYLRFVPSPIRTPEFDRQSALSSSWAFGYLRDADKTEELLLAVLASNDADSDVAMLGEIWAVPDRLLTAAVASAARARYKDGPVQRWAGGRNPLFA